MSTLAEVNPRLKALTEAGVSVWLDQLGRSLVAGGELKRMVTQESLRGVTSNPSIFEKSILGTSDYDDAIAELARADHSAKEIYDTLAIADVQAAADVLAPVHEETDGRDGFVSLAVLPELARETDGTLAKARDVSIPCEDNFAAQPTDYRDTVLPLAVRARVSVEAAATFGRHRWNGDLSKTSGMEGFGA